MTGEKDPRDVMQAEHDAGLSEHPAFRAPAEMPGVEEIAKLISGAPFPSTKSLAKARAVIALFAPILAEKERRIANLTRGLEESAETSVKVGMTWQSAAEKAEAGALAAEAALAAERERCAKVAEDHGALVSNEPIGKACSRNIAAAIRAEGE